MRFEEYDLVKKLTSSGKVLKKLDLSGWIVMRNLLKIGDEIIIRPNDLFNIPVLATVTGISSVNTVGIILHTEGAKDMFGNTWKTGHCPFWMDIMWDIYKIE